MYALFLAVALFLTVFSSSSAFHSNVHRCPGSALHAASTDEDIGELKRTLLQSIGANDRPGIASAARALERVDRPIEEIDGKWSLVYSINSGAEAIEGGQNDVSFFDVVSGNLYKIFFKFAPFLAGGQERRGGKAKRGSMMPKVCSLLSHHMSTRYHLYIDIDRLAILRPSTCPTRAF